METLYPPGTEGVGKGGGAWGGPDKGKCAERCDGGDEYEYVDAGACVFAGCGSLVRCTGGG